GTLLRQRNSCFGVCRQREGKPHPLFEAAPKTRSSLRCFVPEPPPHRRRPLSSPQPLPIRKVESQSYRSPRCRVSSHELHGNLWSFCAKRRGGERSWCEKPAAPT